MRPIFYLSCAVLSLALVLAGTAAWLFQSRAAEIATYLSASGVVVGSHSTISDGQKMFAPIIRFETADGESVEFESRVFTRPPRFKIGDDMTIIYDPKDPATALTDSWLDRYLGGFVVLVFAFVVFLGGAVPMIYWYFTYRLERHLNKHGQSGEARVTDIFQDQTVSAGKAHPWRIAALWVGPDLQQHSLASAPIWADPRAKVALGATVDIVIDPKQPEYHQIKLPKPDKKV